MPLTDTAIRNAKPKKKPYKLFDGGGLFLLVMPQGSKLWRLKFRVLGKENLLSMGSYPEVKLKDARESREETRKLLAAGVDPAANRKAVKNAQIEQNSNTFEIIAREWITKQCAVWEPSHSCKIIRRLELDLFPWLGRRPIADIAAPELLKVLRRIEDRGAVDTAHRALQNAGQIFRYAIATGRASRDISSDLRGALSPIKRGHFAAITDPKAIGPFLRAMDGYQGSFIVKCALRLAPLVFLRPGELRKAEWTEFDLDKAEWVIPAVRMKIKDQGDHIVPLSRQALEIVRDLHSLTGEGQYVFPGARSANRPMSDNAILAAMRRMGISKEEMTGHGFRAMARTILDEILHIRPDFIEHQLAHAVRDPNGRAYNRTAHLVDRRKMMQKWADYLDKQKTGAATVIPFERKAA